MNLGYVLVHSNDGCEEPRVSWDQVGEDELKPRLVALGQDIERLGDSTQLGVDCLGGDVEDAIVADCY